ncbi:MAG: DEAD/DEAH box helicase [Spirochaetales bacterium]|nr:DEAD/DEAH box helicase [Spirochaetales bacterium]
MNQELIAVINADSSINLEWISVNEQLGDEKRNLQNEIFERIQNNFGTGLLYLGFCDTAVPLSASLDFFRNVCGCFAKALVRTPDLESLRENAEIFFPEEDKRLLTDAIPFITGSEHIDETFLDTLWSVLTEKYQSDIKNYSGTVDKYIRQYRPDVHLIGRIYFHLVESKKEEYPFAFLATYSADISRDGKSKHVPLKHALSAYGEDSKKLLELLSTVQAASEKSSLIARLLESGEIFHPLAWETEEAVTFLKEIPVYEEAGILCRIPDWWKNKSAGLSVKISVGSNQPSYLGMDSLLDFKAELLIGSMNVSADEIRQLLKETDGLAFIKGKWIEVDHDKLQKTLEAYEKAKTLMKAESLSLRDAMRFQIDMKKELDIDDADISLEISNGSWLKTVMEKLGNPERIASVKPGHELKAVLREYQQKGLDWLSFLDSLSLGGCLADDMGLGKTVQILAFLCGIRKTQKSASLLILPASLVDNWLREIGQFLPSLKYHVAHPGLRSKEDPVIDENAIDEINRYDIVITTYSLAGKYEWLKNYRWNYIILDEAQAIKNPGTRQTRQIKKLSAVNRIIMTGTPIENKLADLWSLFDFLNPGLLGTGREFTAFTKTLKDNPHGYSRLRNVVGPYILRRLKTDKNVISDLPEKVEMKTYARLSKKQVVLYRQLVDELQIKLKEQTEGIKRKGLVLGSIMKFKQLCNHSDHYLGSGDYNEQDSGKFERLKEICETIMEKRERLLVFTQFREIAEPLREYLASIFQKQGLVFTGSTNVKKRKELVNMFQGHEYVPFMVLSLKAGGTGLNLTAANHVIHFDRWWNPAVENQATDRVFRIGQRKNVIVHKFITKGTIEERIDDMLEEKKKMSSGIIQSTGENWITEMNDEELLRMFTLSL